MPYTVCYTPKDTPKEFCLQNREYEDTRTKAAAFSLAKRLVKGGDYNIIVDRNDEDGDLTGNWAVPSPNDTND